MRVIKSILICLLLATVSFAYTSDWWSLSAGSATDPASANYRTIVDLIGSGMVVGDSSRTDDTKIGFLAALINFAGDTNPPTISDVRIDNLRLGIDVKAGDYIDGDAVLTAVITDDVAVDAARSEVGFDTTMEFFNQLSGNSSYANNDLNYEYSLADGDHTLKILAVDSSGNETTEEVEVKVDSGALKTVNLLFYPNPWNPGSGRAKIGYQLTKSAAVKIFIFNAWNQPVFSRAIVAGQVGARAGYNIFEYDGITNFREGIKPGLYKVKIAAIDEGKKVTATVKFAVLR